MTMDRPTVIQCQATLGDGTVCGIDVNVSPQGNLPKYCDDHKPQRVREKLEREWYWRQKAAESLAEAAEGDEQELEAGVELPLDGDAAGQRICRASSCSIPLSDDWLNEFCPAHWRVLSVEAKGNLVGSRPDEDLHDVAILRALKAINRAEGRADYQAAGT